MAKVEVYTRNYCGFCTRALHLLRNKGVDVTEYNASREPARRAEMIDRSGRMTFPQVFIDGRHIGGSDDLAAFERSGQLDAALERPA